MGQSFNPNIHHMKHISALLALIFSTSLFAQLQNGGFEDLNDNTLPSYWQGNLVLLGMWVDENGVFHVDSVEYDGPSNYFLNTTDVHSGANAVELRNGFNHTTGQAIPGSWIATSDPDTYQGFPAVSIGIPQRPLAIDFWAKCSIAGSDAVFAEVHVLDEAQNEIGAGTWSLDENVDTYEPFHMPIDYSMEGEPVFFQLRFSTAAPEAPSLLGTRLLIDDVSIEFVGAGINEAKHLVTTTAYPNPANGRLNFSLPEGDRILAARAVDATGRTLDLAVLADRSTDVSGLAEGSYAIELRTNSGVFRSRVMVVW